MEDRPYQARAAQRCLAALAAGQAPLLAMRTGSGKTEVAIRIITEGKYQRVLFLVPGAVLLEQTRDRVQGHGIAAQCAWPPRGAWPSAVRAMIVTPMTAANRLAQQRWPGDVDLLIVDEAHHSYTVDDAKHQSRATQIIRHAKAHGVPVLGMTATPWVLNVRGRFDALYDVLVETASYQSLVRAGALAPLKLFLPGQGAEITGGAHDSTGEFSQAGILAGNDASIYTERAIAWLAEMQGDRAPAGWMQTIIYAIGVGHAATLANRLAARGVPVGFVSSRAPEGDEEPCLPAVEADRDAAVYRFTSGALRVLVNYAIVKEGFDCASAEVIVITRPTESLSLYRQMTGRASRPAPGKSAGIVLDCTDNWDRLGPPMAPDVWSLGPRGEPSLGGPMFRIPCAPRRRGGGTGEKCQAVLRSARVKRCPTCTVTQGRHCTHCQRWLRWGHFPAADGGTICGGCAQDIAQATAAAAAPSPAGLYQRMWPTRKARNGTSPGARVLRLPQGGVAGISESATGTRWSAYIKHSRHGDFRQVARSDDKARVLRALHARLVELELLPL